MHGTPALNHVFFVLIFSTLATAAFFKSSGTSLVYAVAAVVLAISSPASPWTRATYRLVAIYASLLCLAHGILQIVLAAHKPFAAHFKDTALEEQLRDAGLIRFNVDAASIIRFGLPDLALAIVGWLCFWLWSPAETRQLTATPTQEKGIYNALRQQWVGPIPYITMLVVSLFTPPTAPGLVQLIVLAVWCLHMCFARHLSAPLLDTLRSLSFGVSAVYFLALCVLQFPGLDLSQEVRQALGLFRYFTLSHAHDNIQVTVVAHAWTQWLLPAVHVGILYVAPIPVRAGARNTRAHLLEAAAAASAAALDDELLSFGPTPTSARTISAWLKTQIDAFRIAASKFFSLYDWIFSSALLLFWACLYPSWFTAVFIVVAFVTIVSPRSEDFWHPALPFVTLYAFAFTAARSIVQITAALVTVSVAKETGLQTLNLDRDAMQLGVSALIAAALACNSRLVGPFADAHSQHCRRYRHGNRPEQRYAAAIQNAHSEETPTDPSPVPEVEQQVNSPSMSVRLATWSKLLLQHVGAGLRLAIRYLFVVTILVIFFAALEDVNLLNFLYLVILVCFMGFPVIREQYWVMLPAYSVVVIFVSYIFGFASVHRHTRQEMADLLGLEADIFTHTWLSLRFHLAILFVSVLQLLTYRAASIAQSTATRRHSTTSLETDTSDLSTPLLPFGARGSEDVLFRAPSRGSELLPGEDSALDEEISEVDPEAPSIAHSGVDDALAASQASQGIGVTKRTAPGPASSSTSPTLPAHRARTFVAWLEAAIWSSWPLVSVLTLFWVGIVGRVTAIRVGFVFLFGVQRLVAHSRSERLMSGVWTLLLLYSSCVFLAKYAYQFHESQKLLQRWCSDSVISDLGLEVHQSQSALFAFLVPSCLVFIVTVFQLRSPSRASLASTLRLSHFLHQPTWIAKACLLVLRTLTLQMHKVVLLLLYASTIQPKPQGLDLMTLLLLAISMALSAQNRLMASLNLFWIEMVMLIKLIYQLPALADLSTVPEANLLWAGLSPIKAHKLAAFVLVRWESFAIFAIALHEILQRYRHVLWHRGSDCLLLDTKPKEGRSWLAFKFTLNHAVRLFGRDVCLMLLLLAALLKLNVVAVLNMAGLTVLALSERPKAVLRTLLTLQAVAFVYQYGSQLGFPPTWAYPWQRGTERSYAVHVLMAWLKIPARDMRVGLERAPPEWFSAEVLFIDFFIMLTLSTYLRVLRQPAPQAEPALAAQHRFKGTLLFATLGLVTLFSLLAVISRRDLICLVYLWFILKFLVQPKVVLRKYTTARQYVRRFLATTLGIIFLHVVWPLLGVLVSWRHANSALMDTLQLFGLRYGHDIRLLDWDPRIPMFRASNGFAYEFLLLCWLWLTLRLVTALGPAWFEAFDAHIKAAATRAQVMRRRKSLGVSLQDNSIPQWFSQSRLQLALSQTRSRADGISTGSSAGEESVVDDSPELDLLENATPEANSGNEVEASTEGLRQRRPRRLSPAHGDDIGSPDLPPESLPTATPPESLSSTPTANPVTDDEGAADQEQPGLVTRIGLAVQQAIATTLYKVNKQTDRLFVPTKPTSAHLTGHPKSSDSPAATSDAGDSGSLCSDDTSPEADEEAGLEAALLAPATDVEHIGHQTPSDKQRSKEASAGADQTELSGPRSPVRLSLAREAFRYFLTHTEYLVYFFVFFDAMWTASLLSTISALLVLLWALPSRPMPSGRFWLVFTYYSCAVFALRYVFQFEFWGKSNGPPEALDPCHDAYLRPGCLTFLRFIGLWRLREHGFVHALLIHALQLVALGVHNFAAQLLGLDHMMASTLRLNEADRELLRAEKHDVALEEIDERLAEQAEQRQAKKKHKEAGGVVNRFRRFLQHLQDDSIVIPRDYYIPSFLIEFLSFAVIMFGWSGFRKDEGFASAQTLQADHIPGSQLLFLLFQFLLIVLDRVIYITRSLTYKLYYHVVMAILIHALVFFWIPSATYRSFGSNAILITLYILKIIYFFLSANQIKSGYPDTVQRNALLQNVTFVGWLIFVIYKAIPFLYELRMLLDWSCIPTTLDLNHWHKMEDIAGQLYLNQYQLKTVRRQGRALGAPQPRSKKFLAGGLLFVLLLIVVWFPLLLISLVNQSAVSNLPTSVDISLEINDYEPIFVMDATTLQQSISSTSYGHLLNEDTTGYVRTFSPEDVQRILVSPQSKAVWTISPSSRERLISVLNDSSTEISLYMRWEFTRPEKTGVVDTVQGETVINLGMADALQRQLRDLLLNRTSEVFLPGLLPSFYHLTSKGTADFDTAAGSPVERNMNCTLRRSTEGSAEWFTLTQTSPHIAADSTDSDIPDGSSYAYRDWLEFVTVNDRVIPDRFSFVTSYGVVGLYVSVVLVIGKFLRLTVDQVSHRIIYEDMPQVTTLQNLCSSIYTAREYGDLRTEEELFALLLQLYRSPDALIVWTERTLLEATGGAVEP